MDELESDSDQEGDEEDLDNDLYKMESNNSVQRHHRSVERMDQNDNDEFEEQEGILEDQSEEEIGDLEPEDSISDNFQSSDKK